MKDRKVVDYVFLHIVLMLYSLGAVFSKLAAKSEFMSLRFIFFYGMVLLIMFVYAIVWQQILKKFDLTVAFANKGIVIAWGLVWGIILFSEQVKINMIIGGILIVIGICMVVSEDKV